MKNIILEKFKKEIKKYTTDVYFVGGCVRDEIMLKQSKDIDIECFNISQQDLEKVIYKISPNSTEQVGKKFGVYKIENLDISLPRVEEKTGHKHKDFEIKINPTQTLKESMKRRDLTINSIYKNIFNNEFYDFYNGIQDIQNKILRVVDSKHFVEDSLRVFRLVQFQSRFEFDIEKNTELLCKSIDVSTLNQERVFEETLKALNKSKQPSIYFNSLYDIIGLKEFYNRFGTLFTDECLKKLDKFKNSKNFKILSKNNQNLLMFAILYKNKDIKQSLVLLKKKDIELINEYNNCKSLKEILIKSFKNENILNFLLIDYSLEEYNKIIKDFKNKKKNLLTGIDIQEILNIPPSKKFSILIDKMRELVVMGIDKKNIIKILIKINKEL